MRRRLSLLIIGLLSFMLVTLTNTLLPYLAISSATLSEHHASSAVSSALTKDVAQLPSLGNDVLDDLAWGFIANELLKAIDGGLPIVANTTDVFPTVNVLPSEPFEASSVPAENSVAELSKGNDAEAKTTSQLVAQLPRIRNQNRPEEDQPDYGGASVISEGNVPFNPITSTEYIIEQLHQSVDGTAMLIPGDYEIPVTMFCMNQSAASPPGHRYVLAPLRGSRAPVIAALNARAAGLELNYQPLQVLSWNIQAGMAYVDMPAASQSLVDQLIPDYRDQLRGSFLEEIERTYNGISSFTNLPSFNSALNQLGEAGRLIRRYQDFRDNLVRYQNDYNRLFDTLIPSGGTTSALGGSERTPWSKLDNRVYARMITQASAGGVGKLQIRVLPLRLTPAGLVSSAVQVAVSNIIADSENPDTQSIGGVTTTESESPPTNSDEASPTEETTDENDDTEVPKPSAPIPDDPTQPPGEDWEWRGNGPVGSGEGAWFNPETGESLHPDLDHPPPIGPHWDYTGKNRGKRWRIYPDGRYEPND